MKKKMIISASISLALTLVLILTVIFSLTGKSTNNISSTNDNDLCRVSISGAVYKPVNMLVKKGTKLSDITRAFGGFKENALLNDDLKDMVITEKKIIYIKTRPLLDINKANKKELEQILDNKQVEKILSYRQNTKITSKEELVKNGFVSKTEFLKIKDIIYC